MKSMVAENNVEWGDDLDGQGPDRAGRSFKLRSILMKTGMMDKLFDLSDDENDDDDGVSARRRGRRRAARATHLRRMRSYSEENLATNSTPRSPPSPRIVKRNLSDDSNVASSPKRSLQRLRSLSEDNLQGSLRSPVSSSKSDKGLVRREEEIVDYMRSMVEEHKTEWGDLDDLRQRSSPTKHSKLIQILEKNGVMDKLFDLSDDDDEDDEGRRPRRRLAARFTHLNRLRSFSDSELKPPSPLASPVIQEIESLSSGSDLDDDEVPCKNFSSSTSPPAEIRQPEKPNEAKSDGPPPRRQSTVNRESMIATRKAFAMASAKNDISFRFKKAKNIQKLQERLENKKAASGTGGSAEGNLAKRSSVTSAAESEVAKDLTKRLEASAARRRMSLATNEQAARNRLEQRLQNRLQQK
jgi:hypothetical protein